MQLVGIQIYNLDIARIKNQRNIKQVTFLIKRTECMLAVSGLHYRTSRIYQDSFDATARTETGEEVFQGRLVR